MTSTWLVAALVVALATASPPKFVTTEPNYDDATEPTTDFLADATDDYDDPEDDDPEEDDPAYDEDYLQSDYQFEDWQSRLQHKPAKKLDSAKNKPMDLARKHFARVKALYSCQTPQMKVVKVMEHYPSSTKTYMPQCTVLHHCSESTGCCPTTHRCGPKTTEKLDLPFFVIHQLPGPDPHRTYSSVKIETLAFYNHTECECHARGDEMPRDVTPTPHDPTTPSSTFADCVCPAPFNPRFESGQCSCDCFDKQHDCIKYKRGRDYLNHQDRLCLEMRKCRFPACDYGVYMRRFGRCPRKDEKYRFH